jgi:hypothetical protein
MQHGGDCAACRTWGTSSSLIFAKKWPAIKVLYAMIPFNRSEREWNILNKRAASRILITSPSTILLRLPISCHFFCVQLLCRLVGGRLAKSSDTSISSPQWSPGT